MKKKKNRYQQKARKKNFFAGMNDQLPTKGDLKNSALETGKVILVGVLGGGLIGAMIGRPSLLAGIATSGFGFYSGNKLVQLVGMGMMASNSFQKAGEVSGLEGLDGIKERLKAYKEAMSERLYLDKILKKKGAATSGFGDLQYFSYPDSSMNGALAALDDIDEQITESARQFAGDDDLIGYGDDDMGDLAGHIM